MFGGISSERSESQASLPPLDSPYLVNATSKSISLVKSPSPNERVQMYKLQEQLKSLQDEIYRKDKLIDQMSKFDLKTCPDKFLDPKLTVTGSVCIEKEEVAALNIKLEDLRSQLREKNEELGRKDIITESLKKINGELREEIARMQVTICSSKKEIGEFNDAKNAFETIRKRNGILITSLQNELAETQQNLMESKIHSKQLELQLSEITLVKEEYHTQIQDLKASFANVSSDVGADVSSVDEIVNKMKTLIFEKETCENKILSLEEKLKSRDCEQNAARQTITRLVSKLSAEEAKTSSLEESSSVLKRELDQFKMSKSIIESDINSFECQIVSLKREIEILTQDNETKDKRIHELSSNTKISYQNSEKHNLINQFINTLVTILSDSYRTPDNDSLTILEWIVGCVKSLLQNKEDISNMHNTIDSLKSDLVEVGKKNSNTVSNDDSRSLLKIEELNNLLKNSEKELVNKSVVIDGLNCDKTKYFRILSELARVMNMSEINKDIGFDMISEALYARAVQLQKLEYDNKNNHRLTEHSLTRKVKELKEQVHSKDLHIDLLHKKLSVSEGKQHNFDLIGKERDKEVLCSKKLAKHNQRLQEEIENLRTEVVELKGSLLNTNKLQANALSYEQEIKTLTAKLDKLETVRQKQSKLLNEYKIAENNREKEDNEMKIAADLAIASLNKEVQVLRDTLEDCKRKEQQLFEMRAVVAKLLGLDIDNLALPDFEIINRLERLIAAHQSNVFTQQAMESTLRDMNQAFFHDPCVLHSHHSHIINEDPVYSKSKLSK